MSLKLIVGLGNPGLRYSGTRHNLGFAAVEKLAEALAFSWKFEKRFDAEIAEGIIGDQKLTLLKPQTFMNLSGISVHSFKSFYKLTNSEILVAYDDYNLKFGESKLKIGGADGGHNGISNIIMQIGADFTRFRLGIHPKYSVSLNLSDFVLGQFEPSEVELLNQLFPQWVRAIQLIMDKGIEKAMNQINQKRIEQTKNTVEYEQHSE
ncbi:MAG: aminoacyl-tRNA hydrolase [Puniceicoccaceae bacterium]|nr:aminoacyl-tRNA hydrolase [Puniceicoccaceae bacterium]RCL30517.1 MAG: aminoacyl-tRNA hydrolase [Puniceicoccaceae bacterium]